MSHAEGLELTGLEMGQPLQGLLVSDSAPPLQPSYDEPTDSFIAADDHPRIQAEQRVATEVVRVTDVMQIEPVELTSVSKAVEKRILGAEYDDLLKAYQHHPDNTPHVRYARDCEGFNTTGLKPFSSERAAISGDEEALFVAYMNQFPLLDGLAHESFLKQKIEAGKDAFLQLQATGLTTQERKHLEQLAIDGAGAFTTFYECNLRLVKKFAGTQPTSVGYSTADTISDGCLGLRRAIQKYDPGKGFKFSTYATDWIRQSVTRRRPATFYDVAFPSDGLRKASKVRGLIIAAKEAGERLDDEQLVELGFKKPVIHAARYLLSSSRISYDAPIGDESESTMKHFLVAPTTDFEGSEMREDRAIEILGKVIERSGINDRRALLIMTLREGVVVPGVDYSEQISIRDYGTQTIADYVLRVRREEMSIRLTDLSQVLGITRERVRQIHEDTIASLLRTTAFGVIIDRLKLDAKEQKEVDKYLQIKGFMASGRPTAKNIAEKQAKARQVISLLSLLDVDFEGSISQTLMVLADELNYSEEKLEMTNRWFRARFGLDEVHTIPIGTKHAEEYDMTAPKCRVVEAIFLAILTRTWGAVPFSFEDLNNAEV